MKKILFLLLLSIASYGQADFPEGINLNGNTATAETSKLVSQQPGTGELNYVNATNLPVNSATQDSLNKKLNISDLPTNLTLYPTNVASDVGGYVVMVKDIHDVRYNTTAVDVSTAAITTTNQLVSQRISDAGVLIGEPGVFNITTFGNIRRLSGSGTATFFFRVYQRTSAGVETLIGESSNSGIVTSASYLEFTASAIWDDGLFLPTDRIVIKSYANRIVGGSDPIYQFQFGGLTPVRTILPVPFSVVDAGYEIKTNKQNSLTTDGTGVKFPTVDAVNVLKSDIKPPMLPIPHSFFLNSTVNGAIPFGNGFAIPIGSTGNGSYFSIIPTILSLNTNAYVGQKILFTVAVKYINRPSLSAIPETLLLQRWALGSFVSGFIAPSKTTYIDKVGGTTTTRYYYAEWTVTQNDIDNNYGYSCFIQVNNTNAVANVVNVTSDYYSIETDNSAVNYITKTVKRNGTVGVDCDYTGRRGIQDAIDAITDASPWKQYIIKASGIFEATEAAHFDKGTTQKSFILLKPYINLIGTSKDDCIISGFLPNNLGGGFQYSSYQTILHNITNTSIENVSIVGENLRYPLHIDNGRLGLHNATQTFKNLKIWHKGNTGDALTQWVTTTPMGLGTSDGHTIVLEDCEIKGKTFAGYMHNNESFGLPSSLKLVRTKILTTVGFDNQIIRLQSLGSGIRDKFILSDSPIDNGKIAYDNAPWIPVELINQRADHAEIELVTNDKPIAFDNSTMTGKGLRIKSKTTGASSTVSFDQTSSAFNLIIGNSAIESTEFINRYNRQQKYGYQYKIGGQALSGFAIGTLDIGQYLVGISVNKYIGALGKRLGDCSTVNKTLTVIIDGTSYNIVFNKNYNGTADTVAPTYSNTTIIAEITAVIGAVADVDEYVVGKDYYPQFSGVLNMTNGDVTEVLSGMGVVFTANKTFRKALNSDGKIDGIVLDDGRIGDECRVITSGEIFAQISTQRFGINEINTFTYDIGTDAGISTVTAGKFDRSANPKVLFTKRQNVLEFRQKEATVSAKSINLSTPTTSASTYDILTRNSSTGVVEKVASSSALLWTDTAGTIRNNNSGEIELKPSTKVSILNAANVETARITSTGSFISKTTSTGFFGTDDASGMYFDGSKLNFRNYGDSVFRFNPIYLNWTDGRTQDVVGFSNSTINPTSGTATFNMLNISPTVNQTGGANGITRSLYINPTLTAAADFRAIEVTGGNSIFQKVIAQNTIRLKNYTVATLPTGTQGDTAYVTDALTPTYLVTVVGGGAVVCPVFFNGTNWVSH